MPRGEERRGGRPRPGRAFGLRALRGLDGAPADARRGQLGHDPGRPRRTDRLRVDEPNGRRGARGGGWACGRDRRPAPVDPAFPGLPSLRSRSRVDGWDEETAELGPGEQAARAWAAIEAAGELGLYGYFTSGVTGARRRLDDGSCGLAGDHRRERRRARAGDGCSGYADAASWTGGDVDPAAVAREAAEKAARTAGADDPGPATYRAVLEPYAFGELLWYFGYSSLGALALLEERSYLAGRIGERIFDPAFSLYDDALDPAGLPKAFDFEGVPKRRVAIVEDGVAKDVVWDRRTAARAGRESTGHALVAPAQSYGPMPFNLSVPAGDASLDELVSRVEDGIYVTRLHYLNIVDPREGLITGMTRDGTFRIEGGKVTRPLVNLRFTTSFPALVASVLGFGDEVRLVNQATSTASAIRSAPSCPRSRRRRSRSWGPARGRGSEALWAGQVRPTSRSRRKGADSHAARADRDPQSIR